MGRGRLEGPPRLAHPEKSAHPVPRGNAAQRPVPGAAECPSPGSRVDRSAEADRTLRSGCCRCPVSSDSKVLCSAACAPDNCVTSLRPGSQPGCAWGPPAGPGAWTLPRAPCGHVGDCPSSNRAEPGLENPSAEVAPGWPADAWGSDTQPVALLSKGEQNTFPAHGW